MLYGRSGIVRWEYRCFRGRENKPGLGMTVEFQETEKILRNYIDVSPEDIRELDAGHINRTFLVTAGDMFVLQCLNKNLYSEHLTELENNYMQYIKAWRRCSGELCEWQCPEWIENREKKYFSVDDAGRIWRLYHYIQGDVYNGDTKPDPMEAGMGLGRLHRMLMECPKGSIKGIFRHLHDLDHYYREYRMQDQSLRPRDRELDSIISRRYEEFKRITVPGGNIIHGDAKIGNMIFNSGKVTGFIDLDTLTEGSQFDDMADCLRSFGIGNDEENISRFIEGYEAGRDAALRDITVELLTADCRRIMFMLGMRYYTDYLAGNVYFRENHPGESLEKARRNIKL